MVAKPFEHISHHRIIVASNVPLVRTTMMCMLVVFLLLGSTSPIAAQEDEDSDDAVKEFADRYNEMFMEREPKLESIVPDIVAFDEHGESFELSSTRGKYTVLVFGCLT